MTIGMVSVSIDRESWGTCMEKGVAMAVASMC